MSAFGCCHRERGKVLPVAETVSFHTLFLKKSKHVEVENFNDQSPGINLNEAVATW